MIPLRDLTVLMLSGTGSTMRSKGLDDLGFLGVTNGIRAIGF